MHRRWRLYRYGENLRGVRTALALLVVYVALGLIVTDLCQDSLGDASFWPANGAVVAGILVLPRRMGWAFCAACLAVNLLENAYGKVSLDHNLLYSALNVGLSFTAAFLTRNICGAATDLSRIRRLSQFAVISIVSAGAEAAIGDIVRRVREGPGFDAFSDWLQWTGCDSLGLLIATPAILLALKSRRAMYATEAGQLERWLLLAVTGGVAVLGLSQSHSLWILLLYPLLVLIAFRAGPPWVLAGVMIIAVPAAGFTVHGYGPIALLSSGGPLMRQGLAQLFLISVFICAVPATNALSERNRTAQRLARFHASAREARTAAEAANAAKSQFIANMSHEIRTPLNGVLGMAQVMANDALSGAQRERLEVIRASGQLLLAILNDVLDFAKIEAGKLELETEPFAINDITLGATTTFTAIAHAKGLSLDLNMHAAAAGVYLGDSVRIRQILYNLISNALKFTEQGHVRVEVLNADPGLEIRVSDTGIGIPADRLSKLFQKFEQADVSTTRRFGGSGLGLAISRELAHRMGGEIFAKSVLGQGSTFTVTLPLVKIGDELNAEPNAPPESASLNAANHLAVRILAAEDNKVNQLVLTTLLGQLGLKPTVVGDGAAAVEAWERGDWDVILMDMQMPIMDGQAATRIIRDREIQTGRSRTPIVALTANVMAHQVRDYLAAGMDGCIAKPIELSQLVSAVDAVLEPPQTDEPPTAIASAAVSSGPN